jgi:hypothetical protein
MREENRVGLSMSHFSYNLGNPYKLGNYWITHYATMETESVATTVFNR